MTINDLYRLGIERLKNAHKDDAEFDSRCLIEYLFSIDSTQFFFKRTEAVDISKEAEFLGLIDKRISGKPLQYIIGKWEFYGNEFYVGDGVLIPRPETEMLIDLASEFLKDKISPVVVDFCSGSGCIAVSIAKKFPNSRVIAIEKFDKAFSFLNKNIIHNNVDNVEAIQGDIFDKSVLGTISPDLILSNPPYIRTDDITKLSTEVLSEPITALDGGSDGYDFYKILVEYWFGSYLKKDASMMLECAEDQGDRIAEMIEKVGGESKVLKDMSGLQRVVTAHK